MPDGILLYGSFPGMWGWRALRILTLFRESDIFSIHLMEPVCPCGPTLKFGRHPVAMVIQITKYYEHYHDGVTTPSKNEK